jgi:hypothetical protein
VTGTAAAGLEEGRSKLLESLDMALAFAPATDQSEANGVTARDLDGRGQALAIRPVVERGQAIAAGVSG